MRREELIEQALLEYVEKYGISEKVRAIYMNAEPPTQTTNLELDYWDTKTSSSHHVRGKSKCAKQSQR